MTRGDVCLARFPFGGVPGSKVRPVLLLTSPTGPVPEVLTAYISSVIPPNLLPSDLLLDPSDPQYVSTKLLQPSVLRLHKLATLHDRDVFRHLGNLEAAAMQAVENKLRTLLML